MRTFFNTAAIVLVWTTIAVAAPRDSQSPYVQTVYELMLKDGSRVYGQVEGESETEVVFRTTSGAALTTSKARILSLRPVVGRMIRGEFRRITSTTAESLSRSADATATSKPPSDAPSISLRSRNCRTTGSIR